MRALGHDEEALRVVARARTPVRAPAQLRRPLGHGPLATAAAACCRARCASGERIGDASTSSRRRPPAATFSCQATAHSPPALAPLHRHPHRAPRSSTKGAGFRSLLAQRHRPDQQPLVDGQRRLEHEAGRRARPRARPARSPAPAARRARSCAPPACPARCASVARHSASHNDSRASAPVRAPAVRQVQHQPPDGQPRARQDRLAPRPVIGDVGAPQLEGQRLPLVLGGEHHRPQQPVAQERPLLPLRRHPLPDQIVAGQERRPVDLWGRARVRWWRPRPGPAAAGPSRGASRRPAYRSTSSSSVPSSASFRSWICSPTRTRTPYQRLAGRWCRGPLGWPSTSS